MRPDSVERHTLSNILDTGSYTINHLNTSIYKQAHQTSARYPKEASEFDATGLSTEYKFNCKVPFVEESNIQLEMEFKQRIDLAINNTIMIIGEIKNIYIMRTKENKTLWWLTRVLSTIIIVGSLLFYLAYTLFPESGEGNPITTKEIIRFCFVVIGFILTLTEPVNPL
mgnify:CR=1 FL=1